MHSVAYSPDGTLSASASADRKIFLFDGTSGEQVRELSGHEGSVFAVAYGAGLASCSADGTVRLWDAETGRETRKWKAGEGVTGQQVGLTWVGEKLVSVAASGELSVIDQREEGISRVLSVSEDRFELCLS